MGITVVHSYVALSVLCVWIVAVDSEKGGKLAHLSVVSVLTPPFLMKKYNGQYEGFTVDLADRLAQIIGVANVSIHEPADGKFGSKRDDGSWDGMIGELTRNEADAAIGPLTITSMRERVVDFTKPFMSTGITMVSKKRTRIAYNDLTGNTVFLCLKPFSVGVWVIIIVAFIVTSALVGAIEKVVVGVSAPMYACLCRGCWWSLQAFTLQGLIKGPKASAAKTLLVFWFAFSAITVSMYIASLVNFLGAEADLLENLSEGARPQFVTREHPIKTIDQLANQNGIKYGIIKDSSTHEFFKRSDINVYQHLYQAMLEDSHMMVDSIMSGMDRVRKSGGSYVFFCESALADYFMRQPPCDIERIGHDLNSAGYGVATPLGSEYRDVLSLAVLHLRESGTLQQLERKWFSNNCADEGITLEVRNDRGLILGRAVDTRQFAGVAVLLIIGIAAAGVVAAVEYTKTRQSPRNPEETQLDAERNSADDKA